jgi:ABC-2 type transport system permease protein
VLTFALRDLRNLEALIPGLLALTLLFATSSMEAIVITFERRIGALERLMLAPVSLPAMLVGKLLGGIVFGLAMGLVVLALSAILFGLGGVRVLLLVLTMLLSASAFSAMGAFVSVSVREVFEAQTLANLFRFPMIFLGGVFLPFETLPPALQVVARALPLTYAVEGLRAALGRGPLTTGLLDLAVLLVFTLAFAALAVHILARRME